MRIRIEAPAASNASRNSEKYGLRVASDEQQGSFEKRIEHRILISDHSNSNRNNERWSDLQPSDLIYLRSEMIINDNHRRYTSAHGSSNRLAEHEQEEAEKKTTIEMNGGKTLRIQINITPNAVPIPFKALPLTTAKVQLKIVNPTLKKYKFNLLMIGQLRYQTQKHPRWNNYATAPIKRGQYSSRSSVDKPNLKPSQ
ncbi:hypothetical protein QQ045_004453 [Rhodiola kirilowii]